MDDDELEEMLQKSLQNDTDNMNQAMDGLIDTVSKFKSVSSVAELTNDDFGEMLASLQFAAFVISGIMYNHGIQMCGHDHDEDEE